MAGLDLYGLTSQPLVEVVPFRFVNKSFKMSRVVVKVVVTERSSALCPDEIS